MAERVSATSGTALPMGEGDDWSTSTLSPNLELEVLAEVRQLNRSTNRWTVVIDDDPTGTQTVRNVPVLLGAWSRLDLEWASRHPSRMCFVLTNSRSLDESDAAALTERVASEAIQVAQSVGLHLTIVSRSDSTLRGHFKAELGAIQHAMSAAGLRCDGVIFAPSFIEAGRLTVGDVQWVKQGVHFRSVVDTEFAHDTTFGFSESSLRKWVADRWTGDLEDVQTIPAPSSVEAIQRRVNAAVSSSTVFVAEAANYCDLAAAMLGALKVDSNGKRILFRTGPSAVRVLCGQGPSLPLGLGTLVESSASGSHGLIVVGSHTDVTNHQVAALVRARAPEVVELDLQAIVSGDRETADHEIARCIAQVSASLHSGLTVLRTSRGDVKHDLDNPLATTRAIAAAVNTVVLRTIDSVTPGYVIAKGGITSSDIATNVLGATRATVEGQAFEGLVPIWTLQDGLLPELTYIVFPGNVGELDALSNIVERLEQREP